MRLDLTRPAFFRFLLASAAVHVALLGLAGGYGASSPRYLGWPELHVRLTAPPAHGHASDIPRPPGSLTPVIMNRTAEIPERLTETHAETEISTEETVRTTGSAVQPRHDGTTPTTLQNFLLGEVQTRLSRYLRYPPLAREKGWEGTVLVGFRMDPDGNLDQIHVARSSGYDVLDQSAVHSLSRVERLEQLTPRLQGQALAMQLPVIYRLIEN